MARFTGAGGGGGATVTVSDTQPENPTEGMIWWDSSSGNGYIYYDAAFVQLSGPGADGTTGADGADGAAAIGPFLFLGI